MADTNSNSSVDTVGVHYSGTLWRWYRNWLGNAEKVKATYGEKWFRVSSHMHPFFANTETNTP